MKTAILHLRHAKLSGFWCLTVPYLTATHIHTQDGLTRTYAVTLAFAHISMHVCTLVHAHSCAHTYSSCAQQRVYARVYLHSCANTNFCTCTHNHIHVCVYTHSLSHASAYILTQSHSYTPTHTRTLMYEHLLRTLVHTQSFTHTRERPLVHAHTSHTRKHLYLPYIHKHTPSPVGIHWQTTKYSFHLGA